MFSSELCERYNMSEIDKVFHYVFIWHTLGPNPCPKCQALNGRVYHMQTLDGFLVDAEFGAIYDLSSDHSLTHGGTGINCHCFLEVRVERKSLR